MIIFASLLLFIGSRFIVSADSTGEWLTGTIRTCDREKILNYIINAERNKTTAIHISEGCDVDELLNSPFCWGHRKLDTGFIVVCGDKDVTLPVIVRENSRINVASSSPIKGGIFATASEDVVKKVHSAHHTTQSKKKPKAEAKPTIERKQKVDKKPADNIDAMKSNEKITEITKIISRQDKLHCKYRLNCYGGDANTRQQKWSIYEGDEIDKNHTIPIKPTSHHDIISTKDVASDVLWKVEQREKSHGSIPRLSQAKQVMSNKKELEERKNVCKYRKSCYNTGKLPKLEHSQIAQMINHLKSFFYESSESIVKADENRQDLSNMTSAEQKQYCKYRKSCYESGVLPSSLYEKEFNYKDVLENNRKEIPIRLRCKYRKSCYETGILPTQSEMKKAKESKSKIVVLPSNPHELKLFCKYRKSCYKEMSETGEMEELMEDDPQIQDDDDVDDEEHVGDIQNNVGEHEEQITESVIFKKQVAVDSDQALYEDFKNAEEDDEEIQDVPEVVLVPKKRKRPQSHQKVKPVKVPVSKLKESKRKKTTESFCDNTAENNEIKSVIENEIPNSIRIKGKSHTKAKDYEETADNIVVISQKRHLRKLRKDESKSDQNEQEGTVNNVKKSQEDSNENELVENEANPNENENSEENDDDSSVTEVEPDSHKSNEEEESEQPTTAAHVPIIVNIPINRQHKLDCKYRKSCYLESGDDLGIAQADGNTKTQVYFPKKAFAPESSDWGRIKKNEQLKCKYRKSCYQLKPLDEDQYHSTIKFGKQNSETNRPLRHNPTSNNSPNNDEITYAAALSREKKLHCKFRHSCYATLAPSVVRMAEARKSSLSSPESRINIPEDVLVNEDKNQIVFVLPNGTVCSKYRISCREQMGLPHKERAPVGRNGQKLCRKKGTTKM